MRMRIALISTLILSACGGQFPPEACLFIDDQVVHVGDRKSVSICFEDADGQEITIDATSSDESVVGATVNERVLALEAKAIGEAVVTVTATDPDGETGQEVFIVKVPNRPPVVSDPTLPEVTLSDETLSEDVDLSLYFSDPDGHALTYTARNLNPDVVTVAIAGHVATLSRTEGLGDGSVEVTATDAGGLSVSGLIPVSASGRGTIFWTTGRSPMPSPRVGCGPSRPEMGRLGNLRPIYTWQKSYSTLIRILA